MVDILSTITIKDDEIEKMDCLPYNLWVFASVCLKVSDEENKLSSSSPCVAAGSIMNIPMSEKKPLPFNLNVKPRTYRRPRSKPIDARALFPCLYKRKLDSPINSDQDGLSQVPKKRRLVVRFKVPPSNLIMDSR